MLNIIQADERNRIVERKEVSLFESKAFNEAIINAVLHNKWVDGNEPMISVFSNRIEILSRGTLAPTQTLEGFFLGESVPANEKLSDIFLQLHLSERSGKGMPLLVSTYGKDIFEISDESIKVTIPYNWQHKFEEVVDNVVDKAIDKLSKTERKIYDKIVKHPHSSQPEIAIKCGVGKTTVQNVIKKLKEDKIIRRKDSNKTGYWEVLK